MSTRWHEHDPLELISSVNACIDQAVEKFTHMGFSPKQIKAVGITNQRETTVVWDKETGEPLYNAVSHCLCIYGSSRMLHISKAATGNQMPFHMAFSRHLKLKDFKVLVSYATVTSTPTPAQPSLIKKIEWPELC
jgi:hypothetical protein